MKRIEAIIRPAKVGEVCAALERVGHPGVMITEIEGHGQQHGVDHRVRGKKYRVDLLAKARLEVVVKDGEADEIVNAICAVAQTGEIGDGKIFVTDIGQVVRIRTGEKGEAAL